MAAVHTAQGLAFVPATPEVAALLHQLLGQLMIEAAADVDAPPPGSVVILPRPEGERAADHVLHNERNGFRTIDASFRDGGTLHLQTPCRADPDYEWSRPGIWYGSEARRDTTGRKWEGSLDAHYVMDDFGTLVPTAGAR